MKRSVSLQLILYCILFFPGIYVTGQKPDPAVYADFPQERLHLFTDRSIYAVKENICFCIRYTATGLIREKPWSTVVYVELIRYDGLSLANGKFPLSWAGAEGTLPVPDDIQSGIYYLRAYTKWMRNFSPFGYDYKPVKIVNPYSDKMISFSSYEVTHEKVDFSGLKKDDMLRIRSDKDTFRTREKVTLFLSRADNGQLPLEISVSVCKKGSNDFLLSAAQSGKSSSPLKPAPEFLPEPRGISVTGKILDKNTDQVVADAFVHLAMLQGASFYSVFQTDEQGRFLFTFPYSEAAADFYIEAVKDSLPLIIHPDSEFCNKPCSPGFLPFILTGEEMEAAQEICINMQIDHLKAQGSKPDSGGRQNISPVSFYGKPARVIYTRRYIRLPNLYEFIFELVPEFSAAYGKKNSSLELSGVTARSALPALCLLDHVPVTDIGKFLSIPVEKIEKIEIVDKEYVSGKHVHDGIFHAFSENRDLAGIDLPENSMFFHFSLWTAQKPAGLMYDAAQSLPARIPDRRNILYWNPSVKLGRGSEQKIEFRTADLKGEYEIVVQGLSASGEKALFLKKSILVQ